MGYGKPGQHCVHGFVDPVCRQAQAVANGEALAVEQNGILGRRREDAAFFETDNEQVGAAGIAGLRERTRVEMSGLRPLGGDMKRLYPLANEAERRGQSTRKGAERAQLANVIP